MSDTKNRTPTRRRCNALENFFATFNVRFAVLVRMIDAKNKTSAEVKSVVVAALQSNDCPWVARTRLSKEASEYSEEGDNESDKWYLELIPQEKGNDAATSRVVISTIPTNVSLGNVLDARVSPEGAGSDTASSKPAAGPMTIDLLTAHESDHVVGILIDVCHALCDGRAMLGFVSFLCRSIRKESVPSLPMSSSLPPSVDWSRVVATKLSQLSVDEPVQSSVGNSNPYLALQSDKILTIEAIAGSGDDRPGGPAGGDTLRLETHPSTLLALRAVTKDHNATLTGLLVASLMASMLSMYFRSRQPDDIEHGVGVAVSILVDLRPHLLGPASGDSSFVQQAFGTVTVDMAESAFGALGTVITPSALLDAASKITENLRRRIARGEALRSAIGMCASGTANSPPPPTPPEATLELSNLGVNDSDASLYTAQRFDGYKGASLMVHTDSNDGVMRWAVSHGGINSNGIQNIISDAKAYFESCSSAASEETKRTQLGS